MWSSASECAADVVDRCRRHGIALPAAELLDLTLGWASMLSGSGTRLTRTAQW